MKCALTAVVAVLAVGCALAGQPPPDDFPIAEKQYRNGARSLFHLHSPYGFVAMWDKGRASFYVYDKGRTNITTTSDLKSFVRALSSFPDDAEVAWVNTCAAPLHYGMPKEMLSRIKETLKQKRFKMATIEENNFILCTCETTNLVFFIKAQPVGVNAKRPLEAQRGSDEDLISRWKIQKVTLADIEEGKTRFDKPGGKEWEKFKAEIKPGDELWYFCSPGETWQHLMGCRGYAIFRAGKLVRYYTTVEN